MSANPQERFLATAATLIARQRSFVARRKAMGFNSTLAESILAEMERSAQLARHQFEFTADERAASPAPAARRELEPAFLPAIAHDFIDQLQSLKFILYCTRHSIIRGSPADPAAMQAIDGELSMMGVLGQALLTAAQLQDGELGLRVGSHPVARLLTEVSNVVAPIAQLSGVHLHLAPVPQNLRVQCDWERMQYAVVSLVIEVAKRTRHGDRVSISARRSGNTVRFALGADTDRLDYRAGGSVKSQASSFRLWLATALIEAQGGRVWSGQPVGRENHIYFTMP